MNSLNKLFGCSPVITLSQPDKHYHARDLRLYNPNNVGDKLVREFHRVAEHQKKQKVAHRELCLLESAEEYAIKQRALRVERVRVGVAHAQGGRPTMEDAHVAKACAACVDGVKKPFSVYAIIDGHGGDETARFLAKQLPRFLEKAISEHGVSDAGMYNALKEACIQLDAQAKRMICSSGAVAVISVQMGSQLWTANVGDARAVLQVGKKVIQLSEDAKPGVARFRKSIEKRGGTVEFYFFSPPRVNGRLAVARAFNDHTIVGRKGHYVVSARPKITKIDLTTYPSQQILLIQACDGVWDVLSTHDVPRVLAAARTCKQAAQRLVQTALVNDSSDNCSALVALLRPTTFRA